MLKKSLIMLKKCTYNSQYIAHYAQVEPTIMCSNKLKTDMRHNETQLRYLESNHFSFTLYSDSKVGIS